tara:strand:+ start:545 stop:874 length:330 start_codon:yes stop_codon:yes gene_type:complete
MFNSYYKHVGGKPIAGQPEIVKVPVCCKPLLLNDRPFIEKVRYYEPEPNIYRTLDDDEFEAIEIGGNNGFRFDLDSPMIGLQPVYANYSDACKIRGQFKKPRYVRYGIM